jgi:hypothetical protein
MQGAGSVSGAQELVARTGQRQRHRGSGYLAPQLKGPVTAQGAVVSCSGAGCCSPAGSAGARAPRAGLRGRGSRTAGKAIGVCVSTPADGPHQPAPVRLQQLPAGLEQLRGIKYLNLQGCTGLGQ